MKGVKTRISRRHACRRRPEDDAPKVKKVRVSRQRWKNTVGAPVQ